MKRIPVAIAVHAAGTPCLQSCTSVVLRGTSFALSLIVSVPRRIVSSTSRHAVRFASCVSKSQAFWIR